MGDVVDLARTSVFLDFDGTVSTADVGLHLLERLAPGAWEEVEARYVRSEIGSAQCALAQWALLAPRSEGELRAVAAEVPLDPDFAPLCAALGAAGAEVTVVSDGFGFYVWEAGRAAGVPVMTATVTWPGGVIAYPYADPSCACAECGTCKRAPLAAASRRGRTTVFVGDGNSDRRAAPLADVLFAKDALAAWCAASGVPYRPFSTLRDVGGALGLALP